MKFFLKGFWQKDYDEVTEGEYVIAENLAGKFGDGITVFFNAHGVTGKTEPEEDEI